MANIMTIYLTDEQYDIVRGIANKTDVTARSVVKKLVDAAIENVKEVKKNAV
jgi:hypothetical protein